MFLLISLPAFQHQMRTSSETVRGKRKPAFCVEEAGTSHTFGRRPLGADVGLRRRVGHRKAEFPNASGLMEELRRLLVWEFLGQDQLHEVLAT